MLSIAPPDIELPTAAAGTSTSMPRANFRSNGVPLSTGRAGQDRVRHKQFLHSNLAHHITNASIKEDADHHLDVTGACLIIKQQHAGSGHRIEAEIRITEELMR